MDSTWWQSDDSDSDIADILITTDVDQGVWLVLSWTSSLLLTDEPIETVNGEVFNAIYYNDLEVVRSLLEAGAALEGTVIELKRSFVVNTAVTYLCIYFLLNIGRMTILRW